MNAKNISIGSIVAVLTLVLIIWQVKDNFVSAGEFKEMKQTVESLKTEQSTLIKKMDQHLELERLEAIEKYEGYLDYLYKKENPTNDDKAKIHKYEMRLEALLKSE